MSPHKRDPLPPPPLQSTVTRISLTLLLLWPARLPAQPASTPEPDAAAARTICDTELAAGHYAEALPACQAVLRNAEKLLGTEDESVGYWLLAVGRALHERGKYAEAVPRVQRALRILEKAHGNQHPDVARALNNLAELYRAQGQYPQAEALLKRSLDISEKALGSGHRDVATSLNNLAGLYKDQGQYARAEPLFKRSLVILEKALSSGHPDVATSLDTLAGLYAAQGQYALAEPLYKRSLGIREKALGSGHPDVSRTLINLAELYRSQGQYALAEPLIQRSLVILEKALGPGHPDLARSLHNLATLYQDLGQYAQAEPLFQRSLDIREKALGPGHPDVATSLNNLAELYKAQRQYSRAEPLFQRSLYIREQALGPGHPDVATSLNSLAELYKAQGQYSRAEPLFQRSLYIRKKALGSGHPHVAISLSNLAELYRAQGQYPQAEPLFKRSLDIWEKALPATHPARLASLDKLAQLYLAGDTPSLALPYLEKLLERSLQREGLYDATSLGSLEQLARLHGHLAHTREATAVYDRLLSLLVSTPAPGQPLSGRLSERLATLLERGFFDAWLRRDYVHAAKLAGQVQRLPMARDGAVAAALGRIQGMLDETTAAQRAVLSRQARLAGDRVDDQARRLLAAASEVAADRPEEAAWLLTEGLHLGEQHLRRRLGEAEVRAFLDVQRPYLELCFELSRRHPQSVALGRLAWLASLLSQGRTLDAEMTKLRVLRSEATLQKHGALAQRWNDLSAKAHKLALGGQGGSPLVDVRQQQQQTEDLMLKLAAELHVEALPESWEILRRVTWALKKDEALVHYIEYVAPPLADEGGNGTRRYLALVLQPGGGASERTQVVDLGEVAMHQPALERLLHALHSPNRQPQAAAKDVYLRLLAPVRKAVGAVGTLYVVPDGALSLIPLDALVDEGGKYVIEGTQRIRYLASGRELLREYGAASGRPPLVLGDPDLDAVLPAPPPPSAKGAVAQGQPIRGEAERAASLYAGVASLEPLAHARAEALALGRKLQVTPLVGNAASEPRLRQEAKAGLGPKILHLAMHGLFPDATLGDLGRGTRSRLVPVDEALLPPAPPLPVPGARPGGAAGSLTAGDALDPMLHSALVLAGAKRAQAQRDSNADGVLTADEARTLSLEGTELTVLSACQTALGSLRAGNGVDGLRRAFLIAGSEAVVASLWRVSDPGTRSLMQLYYEQLIDHRQPRITALRLAMQAIKKDRPHPYYWAPFVAIGRDEPLRPLGHALPDPK